MRAPRHLTFALLAACAGHNKTVVEGQVLLYFDTDAPLPTGPGQPPSLAAPLFDRLRVDVLPPGGNQPCAGCRSEFEIDASLFASRRASVGIAPPSGGPGYRARVRLFRRAFAAASGEPDAESTVDVTVALPVVVEGALTEVTVVLLTETVGRPTGSPDAPAEPAPGPPQSTRVGTWAGARRVSCQGNTPPGAVCVPGGAFWMGNPNLPGFAPGREFRRPRLVVLSPYFLSASEVTVRQYRASGRVPKGTWSGSSTGATSGDWCTFTTAPGAFEDFPLICETYPGAQGYCAGVGGNLPTEAQFEYAAGALRGDLFPWGQDEPSCAEAVYGRGGWGQLADVLAPCHPSEAPGGPLRPGQGTRDRVDLPGGSIVDLAGNASEWTRDLWNRIDEPCWTRAGVYRDPWCTTASPTDGLLVVYRGGNWVETPSVMGSSQRTKFDPNQESVDIGFRCAWPATR
jgi:formylglycine-generating enzyme required for sulfatase activity